MYYLQVMETERYRLMAGQNRVNLRLLPPLRGKIVDRFGLPIADNDPNYRVVVVPEQTADMRATLKALARVLPIEPDEIERILRERYRYRSFVPIPVRENLTWDQVSRVEINSPDLPGASIEVDQSR